MGEWPEKRPGQQENAVDKGSVVLREAKTCPRKNRHWVSSCTTICNFTLACTNCTQPKIIWRHPWHAMTWSWWCQMMMLLQIPKTKLNSKCIVYCKQKIIDASAHSTIRQTRQLPRAHGEEGGKVIKDQYIASSLRLRRRHRRNDCIRRIRRFAEYDVFNCLAIWS